MARTTADQVRALLDTDESISMTPFIDTANDLVTWLDGQDSDDVLDATTLELIERYLAAHYYQSNDMQSSSEGLGRANASYRGETGMFFKGTIHGQRALELDYSGTLLKRQQELESGTIKKVGITWLGEPLDSERPLDPQ